MSSLHLHLHLHRRTAGCKDLFLASPGHTLSRRRSSTAKVGRHRSWHCLLGRSLQGLVLPCGIGKGTLCPSSIHCHKDKVLEDCTCRGRSTSLPECSKHHKCLVETNSGRSSCSSHQPSHCHTHMLQNCYTDHGHCR